MMVLFQGFFHLLLKHREYITSICTAHFLPPPLPLLLPCVVYCGFRDMPDELPTAMYFIPMHVAIL